jgi:hypothetical protein
MLIRNELGSSNPSLLVKICLQFLPSGESTTTLFVAIPAYISSHIVNLDPEGKLIDRAYIPGSNSTNISLRDGTIKCTEWKTNTIYCIRLHVCCKL